MGYKYLNLEFLQNLIPDMPEEITGLLQLSVENINEIVENLKKSLEVNSWDTVNFYSHQLKTNFNILGMDGLAKEIQTVEHDAKVKENLETLAERTNSVLLHWNEALTEIEMELSK